MPAKKAPSFFPPPFKKKKQIFFYAVPGGTVGFGHSPVNATFHCLNLANMFMIRSMDMAQSAPDPALAEPPDPHRERAERHGRVLARLGDLTLGLAEAVQGQAVEAARRPVEEDAAADRTRGLGLVFARLSYEVRQSVALEARLAAEGPGGRGRAGCRRGAGPLAPTAEPRSSAWCSRPSATTI